MLGDMPQPTNVGFGTQDNFRKFSPKHDNGQWHHLYHQLTIKETNR